MAKISLACSSPQRERQSVVLEGIQGQTHPRALGAIKADDHIRPRLRQPTPVLIVRCAEKACRTHPIWFRQLHMLTYPALEFTGMYFPTMSGKGSAFVAPENCDLEVVAYG
jgi:hypothetical protein